MAKTANIGRLSVSLSADTAKYTAKLKKAQKDSANLGKGMMSMGKFAKSGAAVAVSAFAATAVAAKQLADQYIETEKQLKSLAETSGLTSKELKAQAYAMSSAGLEVEKLGDIYKDVKDKTSEFAAAGSGAFQDFIDVMKLTKSEGRALSQELQFLSGPQVLQHVVREMDKAEVSMGQMVFVMESLGSDASRLTEILKDQTGQVQRLVHEYDELAKTADPENIAKFMEAQKQSEIFFNNIGALAVDVLGPIMESFASGIENINKLIPKTKEDEFGDFGKQKTAGLQIKFQDLGLKERNAAIKAELEKSIKIQSDAMAKQRAIFENPENIEVIKQYSHIAGKEITIGTKLNEQAQIAKDGFDQFAIETKTLREEIAKLDKQTKQYEESLDKLRKKDLSAINDIAISATKDAEILENQRYVKAIQNLDNNYGKQYGVTKEFEAAKTRLFNEHMMKKKAIEDKINAENLAKKKKYEQDKLSLELMLAPDESAEKLQLQMEQELFMLEMQYAKKEGLEYMYQQNIDKIKEEYAKKEIDRQARVAQAHQRSQALVATYALNAFGDMGAALQAWGDQSETAAKVGFAVAKGAAVGQAIMNAHKAYSEAWADPTLPYPAKVLASVSAFSNVMGAVASIKSTTFSKAHSGLDEVPQSHDDTTFLLKAGERVVQPQANKDLTAYLNKQKSNNGGNGNGQVIHAPLTINGSVTDEKWFDAQLVKHRNTIAGSVRKVEKERPQTRRR